MKNILITGCAGFIGSHLTEYYLNQDCVVFGLDNFSTGTKENLTTLEKYKNFHFKEFDISNPWDNLNILLPENSLLFHLASPAAVNHYQSLRLETMWANSIGLGNALEFAKKFNSKLIYSSTSEIYGSPTVTPQSESYWGYVNSFGERSCYDESKRFGEALIYSWNRKYNTQHGIVRIFNTYGPRMNPTDGRVVLNFIRQALSSETITLHGEGEQTRSFCYISDLIRGIDQYAHSNISIPINLGNDEEIKIFDLLKMVLELTQSKSKIIKLTLPADDPPQRRPDLALAKNLLNFSNQVSIYEGIKKLIMEMGKL